VRVVILCLLYPNSNAPFEIIYAGNHYTKAATNRLVFVRVLFTDAVLFIIQHRVHHGGTKVDFKPRH